MRRDSPEYATKKAELTGVIIAHLKTVGYPDMTNEEIAEQGPEIWEKLLASRTPLPGVTRESFLDQINTAFIVSNLRADMERIHEAFFS